MTNATPRPDRRTGNTQPDSRENLYFPCTTGSVLATSGTVVHVHLPFYGCVVISLDGSPIEIEIGPTVVRHQAMALWAKDALFNAPRTPFLCVNVNPLHHDFRAFTQLPRPHVLPLERSAYASFDPAMSRALDGDMSFEAALDLYRGVMTVTRGFLPRPASLDERGQILMNMLWQQPRASIAELAEVLNLSYHRTSHLFAEAVGLPVRTYQLWQKLYKAAAPLNAGASLTDAAHAAGFVDSAHYSRAFQTAYGRCPTDMFRRRSITMYRPESFREIRTSREP